MPQFRAMAVSGLWLSAISLIACHSPSRVVHPVIYAHGDETAAAMRSAPVILLVRISDSSLTGARRCVAKPQEAGGPMCSAVPLHLARIKADVLVTLRGHVQDQVEFYSWIWASGSHGGPRLFHPNPGGVRVVFLRKEGEYLHTVGDYPAYDLEVPAHWAPAIVSGWKAGVGNRADPVERLVALLFRTGYESQPKGQLRAGSESDGPRINHYWASDLPDLIELVGPFFVATQLDSLCHDSTTPSAQVAARLTAGEYLPGRCEAFRVAKKANIGGAGSDYLTRMFESCKVADRDLPAGLRSGDLSQSRFGGLSKLSPPHRRELLRAYASAMDDQVRLAACDFAATTAEAHDIPECAAFRGRK